MLPHCVIDDRWAYSPLLATMNTVHITSDTKPSSPRYTKLTRLSESTALNPLDGTMTPPKGPVTISSDRRKWLSSYQARTSTAFPSTYISGDFSNPFIDFNSFSVQLPYVGLKVDVLKYWTRGDKRQPLRYVCRLRPKEGREDVLFFVILFELIGDGIVRHDTTMESDPEVNYKAPNQGNEEKRRPSEDANTMKNDTDKHEADELGVD
jgi:Protein of unknown function (DUF1769)